MAAAAELAPFGITANIVHPPVTDTGWVTDEVRAFVRAVRPSSTTWPTPAEVADVDRLAVQRCGPPRHRERAADALRDRLGAERDRGRPLRQAGSRDDDAARARRPRASHAAAAPRARRRGHLAARRRRPAATLLLAELDYARHPHAHEGVAPRYGALLATPDALRRQPAGPLELVDIWRRPARRRPPPGRRSLVVRGPHRRRRRAAGLLRPHPRVRVVGRPPRRRHRRPRRAAPRAGLGAPVARRRASPRGTASSGRRSRCRIDLADAGRRPRWPGPIPTVLANIARAVHALAGRRARRGDARVEPRRRPPRARPPRAWRRPSRSPTLDLSTGAALRRRCSTPCRSTTGPRSSTPRGTRLDGRRAPALVGAVAGTLGPFRRHPPHRRRCGSRPTSRRRSSSSCRRTVPLSVFWRGAPPRHRLTAHAADSGAVTGTGDRQRRRSTRAPTGRRRDARHADGGDHAADPGDDERRPVRPGDVAQLAGAQRGDRGAHLVAGEHPAVHERAAHRRRTGRCTGPPSAAPWPPSPGRRRP